MDDHHFIDTTFNKIDALQKGEYESCVFNQCTFSGLDLSGCSFTACTFNGCNLSLAKINKTSFQQVSFKECKLLGLRFDTCNGFGLSFSFDECQLNHASFYHTKIIGTVFRNSSLEDTDFSEADLTGVCFDTCNLQHATFDRTNLEKADFRTAQHFSIDPETNRIRKAKFSAYGIAGLLHKYDIEIDRS